MTRKPKDSPLHIRNRHRPSDGVAYHFAELTAANPDLANYVSVNPRGQKTIDFSDPKAVTELNRALILAYYDIQFWQIPEQFLCPAVPGRADYIHHLADLLRDSNDGQIPTGKHVSGIDIGTGANVIYPIIGAKEYGWKFVATEVNPMSFQCAKTLAESNKSLKSRVKVILQNDENHIFNGVIKPEQRFTFTLCNPPFHSSAEQAQKSNSTKRAKLQKHRKASAAPMATTASTTDSVTKRMSVPSKGATSNNFGGQNSELWCEGGEVEFVCKMVRESSNFQSQVLWFSSLVSKQDSLPAIEAELKKTGAQHIKIINMGQGQKISRFIAWSFIPQEEHAAWF